MGLRLGLFILPALLSYSALSILFIASSSSSMSSSHLVTPFIPLSFLFLFFYLIILLPSVCVPFHLHSLPLIFLSTSPSLLHPPVLHLVPSYSTLSFPLFSYLLFTQLLLFLLYLFIHINHSLSLSNLSFPSLLSPTPPHTLRYNHHSFPCTSSAVLPRGRFI